MLKVKHKYYQILDVVRWEGRSDNKYAWYRCHTGKDSDG